MKNTKITLFALAVLLIAGAMAPTWSSAADRGKKKKSEQKVTAVKKTSEYDKLFKDPHTTASGFVTLHMLKGKLYVEMPLQMIGRQMLIASTLTAVSDNANSIVGSKPSTPLYVTFSRTDSHVQLRQVNSDYEYNPTDKNLAAAIGRNTLGAVMLNMPIAAWNRDSTAVVFDMTDFFVGENKLMSPFDDFSLYTMAGYKRSEAFERDKSYLEQVKAFKDNAMIRSVLSYKYTLVDAKGRKALSDQPYTAVVSRSIVLLDTLAARPRIGDYRMAIFPTGKYQFTGADQRSQTVYYSNRWRLEPVDQAAYLRGELVEPKKPIVFYIDPDFPPMWREYIREGVNQWSEMFQTVGFKNAIRAVDYPTNDPEFDPDNLKYSCIRYAPVAIQNAMGPSWVDPRTGEILNASVYVYHDIIQLLNNWMFVQTAQADQRVRSVNIPQEVIGDGLRYVISHEVGHCLGLMHNMSASAVIPVDSLRSPTYTQKYGTTTSIMDYARFNYVAQPGDFERGVRMTPPRFGLYDYFTIKWLYTWMGDKTPQQEQDTLETWIRRAAENPIYRYGRQMMTPLDPRSQTEDLGDDAVKASQYGIKSLKYVMDHFDAWTRNDDPDGTYRTSIYDAIINQYVRYMNHVYANVGGMFLSELKSGDPGEPFRVVGRAQQRRALQFMCSHVGESGWLDNESLQRTIGMMGRPSELVDLSLAKAIIAAPYKVAAVEKYGSESYTSRECADDVYRFVWVGTMTGKRPTNVQMKIQKMYVNQLLEGAKLLSAGGPSTNQITSFSNITVESPVPCKPYADGWDTAGYDGMSNKFAAPTLLEAHDFAQLQKTLTLLKRAVSSSTGETQAHYRLLVRNIENAINLR